MSTYLVRFAAVVERLVEVPNDLNWTEAYQFTRDQLGWYQVAHAPAAKLIIDTTKVVDFQRQPRLP